MSRRGAWAALGLLCALAGAGMGCEGRAERRPWVVCYRIYEQCKERVGGLTRRQCEELLAARDAADLERVVACTRDRACPGIADSCVGSPPGP